MTNTIDRFSKRTRKMWLSVEHHDAKVFELYRFLEQYATGLLEFELRDEAYHKDYTALYREFKMLERVLYNAMKRDTRRWKSSGR